MKKACLGILALLVLLAGCADRSQEEEIQPEADGCQTHIGLVTDRYGVDDNAFNFAVWNGIQRFAEETELKSGCYAYWQAMEDEEAIPYLTQLAEEKYDLIIAADTTFVDAVKAAAAIYPERSFLLIDHQSDQENVAGALFRAEEGSYLAGIAAALKAQETDRTTVGFIGGKSGELIGAFQAGFEQGVAAIDPTMTIFISYTEDFYDQESARDLAFQQYEAGAAVIYHAAGNAGSGVIEEAKERETVYVIGVDHDQYEEGMLESGQSVVLTSMIKQVDQASYLMAKAVMEGTFEGGTHEFGLANDGVGLELSLNRNLTAEQIETIEQAAERIKKGELEVSDEATLPITDLEAMLEAAEK